MNYNEPTRRYFESTPAAGKLQGGDVGTGAAGSRQQGAWVQFDLRVGAAAVTEARFRAFGCPHTIAVASWVAEHAPGQTVGAALPASVLELSGLFAVPAEKRGRLLVVEDAWIAAMEAAAART